MLNANEAAAKTAMGKAFLTHGHEMRLIEQRIDGAAAAGLSTAEVVFEGNVFDETTIEIAKQVLLDQGYQVVVTPEHKLGHLVRWRLNVSW